MAEYTYTYENIIIDPSKECIKNIIGKEVYFNNNPSLCLAGANEKSTVSLGVLVEIHKDSIIPFVVERNDTDLAYSCIIVKKEEPKSKYVPFESITEFLDAYRNAPGCLNEEAYYLSNHGIWLKRKDKPYLLMVTEIYSFGVVISGDMNTINKPNDEYVTITETTLWRELLRGYTFLDGSPCGKESKDV